MDIAVVGAGIGGLMAARLLARAGHAVTVLEKSAGPRAVGAGIVLPLRTVSGLQSVGMELHGLGRQLTGMAITTADGRARGTARGRFSFVRSELLTAMGAGMDQLVDLRYDAAVDEVKDVGDRARCRIDGRDETFDFVVGADGLHSSVRESLHPSIPLRFSNQLCWRGVIDGARGDRATEMWNGKERIGIVPLSRSRTYVYVVRPVGAAAGAHGELATISDMGEREHWAMTSLQQLPPADLLRHGLWELDRPVWGAGRVALIGDAAHASTPNLGLGAALAIADADALTRILSSSPEGAVERYRRTQHRRVRTIQLTSRTIGRLAHNTQPLATTIRRALSLQSGGAGANPSKPHNDRKQAHGAS